MLTLKKRIPLLHLLFIGLLPSFLKKMIYRAKGYNIGRSVALNFGCIIIGEKVEINDFTKIGYFAMLKARNISIDRYVTIGAISYLDTETIEIGEDSRIREQVFVGGLICHDSMLKLGKRCIIMQGSYLNPTKPIVFGNDSGVGGKCCIFTHGSWLSELEGYPVSFAPVSIGNNVWIPWNVFILPGVSIGNNVVIGASSHVTRNIPDNCLASGNPAKIIVRKFPFPVPEKDQQIIKQKIFEEFILHLKYHGFTCVKNNLDSGFELSIHHKKKAFQIVYLESMEDSKISAPDYLIILDFEMNIPKLIEDNNEGMVVNLKKRTRTGSTEIGEEFVTFISRYGIRFERLD